MNDNGKSWFAVYTKPRQEQVALEHLQRQSFDCFLPMATAREPLFPNYLFLRADQTQQSLSCVRSTRGAVGLVRAGLTLSTVPDLIINQLKARIDWASGCISLCAAGLCSGDAVRVFDGPLAPMEGVFKEHRGRNRSLMLLEILGRSTAVELDSRMLQRIR